MPARSRLRLFTRIALTACALSASALGHAPPLASALLSNSQGRPSLLVSNRGLLFRAEADPGWSLLCNEALGINTAELPAVVLLPDESVLVGTTAGLLHTNDRGCSWLDVDSLGSSSTPALVSDPSNPATLYAFVFAPGQEQGGLRKSSDGGQSFQLVYRSPDEDYVDSLLVATANPQWVYATGTRFAAGELPSHFLLRSTDGGLSWIRIPLPLDAKEYRAPLLTTDPAQPEGVLIGTISNTPKVDPARVLRSDDGGQSFRAIFSGLEIASARYTEDGASLIVADQQGLQLADAHSLEFRASSPASNLGCAFEIDGELLVCGHYEGPASPRSGVGSSRDGGASFTSWLDFADVVAPVSCASDSKTAALCSRPWQDWTVEMAALRTPSSAPSSGAPSSGMPSSSSPATPSASSPLGTSASAPEPAPSDGCNVPPPGRGGAWWLLLPLLVYARRRNRALRSSQRPGSSSRQPHRALTNAGNLFESPPHR
jgi:photosystem II stability/assembly factor-like uncharacterized protein